MNRIGLDSLPPVTEDEALELCVHHLQLAAIYYMNVTDDLDASLSEAKRIIMREVPGYTANPTWAGAEAFVRASWENHDKRRREWPDVEEDAEPDETVQKYLKP